MKLWRFRLVTWWLRPRQQSKIKQAFDQHVTEALEQLEGAETLTPTLVSQHQVAAALAQVPRDRRKVLVVHPEIDNLPLIKCEAAKLGLHVVLGDSRLIRPGEAYLIKDMNYLKKEAWE